MAETLRDKLKSEYNFDIELLAKHQDFFKGLTFFTLSEDQKNKDRSSVSTNDIVMTIVVLLLILFAYIYFSG